MRTDSHRPASWPSTGGRPNCASRQFARAPILSAVASRQHNSGGVTLFRYRRVSYRKCKMCNVAEHFSIDFRGPMFASMGSLGSNSVPNAQYSAIVHHNNTHTGIPPRWTLHQERHSRIIKSAFRSHRIVQSQISRSPSSNSAIASMFTPEASEGVHSAFSSAS